MGANAVVTEATAAFRRRRPVRLFDPAHTAAVMPANVVAVPTTGAEPERGVAAARDLHAGAKGRVLAWIDQLRLARPPEKRFGSRTTARSRYQRFALRGKRLSVACWDPGCSVVVTIGEVGGQLDPDRSQREVRW